MRTYCLFLLASMICFAQAPLISVGRQALIFQNRVLVRETGHRSFRVLEELPPLNPTVLLNGTGPTVWDGFNLYRLGWTSDRRLAIEVGEVVKSGTKEHRWFWSQPHFIQSRFHLLGAWNHRVLVGLIKEPPEDNPDTKQETITLAILDPSIDKLQELLEFTVPKPLYLTSAVVEGAGFIFASSGEAFRVDFAEQKGTRLTESFWKDLGLKVCKDTGEFENPSLFGKAFLDADGSILVPAQPMLVLEREDFDRAWERLSPERKAEVTKLGYHPFDPEKGLGWKDLAIFFRFHPDTGKFDLVEEQRYKHLVEEKDANFIIRVFSDHEPKKVYFTDGDKIQDFESASLEQPEPAANTKKNVKPGNVNASTGKGDLKASKR